MYLTMNRFKVKPDRTEAFEAVWKNRDSHLAAVPGFRAFHLLRGAAAEDHVLYASHTTWDSETAFRDWTRSEAFRAAHANAGSNADLYQGAPELEIFESLQDMVRP